MKTISRSELQEIVGVSDASTLLKWENDYQCLPIRLGTNNNQPFFDVSEVIKRLESRAFPFKVRPTALDDLRKIEDMENSELPIALRFTQ